MALDVIVKRIETLISHLIRLLQLYNPHETPAWSNCTDSGSVQRPSTLRSGHSQALPTGARPRPRRYRVLARGFRSRKSHLPALPERAGVPPQQRPGSDDKES